MVIEDLNGDSENISEKDMPFGAPSSLSIGDRILQMTAPESAFTGQRAAGSSDARNGFADGQGRGDLTGGDESNTGVSPGQDSNLVLRNYLSQLGSQDAGLERGGIDTRYPLVGGEETLGSYHLPSRLPAEVVENKSSFNGTPNGSENTGADYRTYGLRRATGSGPFDLANQPDSEESKSDANGGGNFRIADPKPDVPGATSEQPRTPIFSTTAPPAKAPFDIKTKEPKISGGVGDNQRNAPADVLTVQRLYNKMIDEGHIIYDDGPLPMPKKIAESGRYDEATKNAIHDLEKRYFYGVGAPGGIVMPGSSLFKVMVDAVNQPGTTGPKLAPELHDLAAKMVPGGATRNKEGGDNIGKHLPDILSALETEGISDPDMVIMALATIRAESSGFLPISEGKSSLNTTEGSDHDFDVYDTKNGNRGAADAERYRGRGFVQLSGRGNYERVGREIGYPELVNHPEMANDPKIAALILAHFLKNREPQIRTALKKSDLRQARRLVNGGSNGLDAFIQAVQTGRKQIDALRRGKSR